MANPERGLRDIVGQIANSCCWIEIRQLLREQPPRSNHVWLDTPGIDPHRPEKHSLSVPPVVAKRK
jgi:hypothetical protein